MEVSHHRPFKSEGGIVAETITDAIDVKLPHEEITNSEQFK
jgi:hypothetical protein